MTASDALDVASVIAATSSLIGRLESTVEPIFGRLTEHTMTSLEDVDRAILPVAMRGMDTATLNLPGEAGDGPIDWSAYYRLQDHVDGHVQAVERAVDTAHQSITQNVHSLIEGILPDIPTIVAKALELFGGLVQTLTGDLTDVGELWGVMVATLRERLPEHAPLIRDFVVSVLLAAVTQGRQGFMDIDVHTLHETQSADLARGDAEPSSSDFTSPFDTYNPFMRNLAYIIVQVMTAYQHLSALASGSISRTAQAGMRAALPTPISPGLVAQMIRREIVGADWGRAHVQRSGVSNDLFDLEYQLTRNFLSIEQILEHYRRVGDDSAIADLPKLGYEEGDIATLKELSQAVATPSDVVRFLVRDVFDAKAIDTGKLDAEFEDKYNEEWFRKAGVSKELAKLYWMAHWQLPSPTQIFEFIHREQLTVPEARAALAQADYAPGFIEKYINVSYNVPGRIDVRRMWETGVITDRDELTKRYRFMGYSPDDAEILARFTEALAAKSKDAEAERHRGPIAREIVRAFEGRSLTESAARDSLIQLGYTADNADAKLREGEYGRARDRGDRIRRSLHSQYTKGFLDKADAESRLSGYGFGGEEIGELFESWDLDLELAHDADEKRHQKDLTKNEILAGYGERLVDRGNAASMLQSLGYDGDETETLLALEESKLKRTENRAAEAAIHALYTNRRQDDAQTRTDLLSLGYLPDHVEHLLTRWTLERENKAPEIPTSMLEKLLFQGIVPLEQLTAELVTRGYSERDVNWLSTLWGTDVSIAGDKLAEQRRQFETREQRLTRQQDAVQSRFETTTAQRQALQTERLQAQTALVTERNANQVARDATNFEHRQTLQAKQISAQADRLAKQIDAAHARATEAIASRERLAAQSNELRRQALAAQDARQTRQLAAQADRLDRQIQAQDARASAAVAARESLANLNATHQEHLVTVRSQIQEARDVRLNAQRIAQEQRQETTAVRREARTAARQDIRTADTAAAKAALQSIQTQRDALTAELNQRIAALESQAAGIRLQQAAAQRQAAEQALAANTPTDTFLDTVT